MKFLKTQFLLKNSQMLITQVILCYSEIEFLKKSHQFQIVLKHSLFELSSSKDIARRFFDKDGTISIPDVP